MNEKSINTRIKYIRELLCNNSNIKFAKQLGKEPNTTSNWVRDGYSVGRGVASDIVRAFPQIDIDWILTGEGEMLKEATSNSVYSKNISSTKGENNQITQYADTVFHENGTNFATEKQYKTRIAEMEKNYKLQLASKDELIKEKDERIKELNTMIKMLYERK